MPQYQSTCTKFGLEWICFCTVTADWCKWGPIRTASYRILFVSKFWACQIVAQLRYKTMSILNQTWFNFSFNTKRYLWKFSFDLVTSVKSWRSWEAGSVALCRIHRNTNSTHMIWFVWSAVVYLFVSILFGRKMLKKSEDIMRFCKISKKMNICAQTVHTKWQFETKSAGNN